MTNFSMLPTQFRSFIERKSPRDQLERQIYDLDGYSAASFVRRKISARDLMFLRFYRERLKSELSLEASSKQLEQNLIDIHI